MRYLYFITALCLWIIVFQSPFKPSVEVPPTPVVPLSQFSGTFPLGLYCLDIESPYIGPQWSGVQIGVTTVEEFHEYVLDLHPTFKGTLHPNLNLIGYGMDVIKARELKLPNLIDACFDPETEVITAISPNLLYENMTINDLVIEYGKPDVVTWRIGTETRVAFWFEHGIAATVYVNLVGRFEPFGTVLSLTYFPFQPVEGFETRWPFNRTASEDLIREFEGRATLTPEVPNVANPFDFDAMIATITAQPTRTPTPTFTPWTPAPSRTPTPMPAAQTSVP